jgi:hypothetical protein
MRSPLDAALSCSSSSSAPPSGKEAGDDADVVGDRRPLGLLRGDVVGDAGEGRAAEPDAPLPPSSTDAMKLRMASSFPPTSRSELSAALVTLPTRCDERIRRADSAVRGVVPELFAGVRAFGDAKDCTALIRLPTAESATRSTQ